MDGTVFADEHAPHTVHVEIGTLRRTHKDVVLVRYHYCTRFLVDE